MPRWDRPLDHPDSPYRQSLDTRDLPGASSERPIEGDLGLWLYIGKALLIFLAGGLLLSNAMYGFFGLLALLGGG
jgi:hypothetical protein